MVQTSLPQHELPLRGQHFMKCKYIIWPISPLQIFHTSQLELPYQKYSAAETTTVIQTTTIRTITADTIMKYFTQHLPTGTSHKRDCLDQAILTRLKKLARKTSHCLQKEPNSAESAKKPKQSAPAYGEYSIPYIFC